MTALPWIDARDVRRLLPMPAAIEVIESALRDPAGIGCPARTGVDVRAGQLLLMPAEGPDSVGVKIAAVAPRNPERGLARVQAVYLLFDAGTLQPRAVIDGVALTSLRTPAVSAVAARRLALSDATNLVVFGTGPQAWHHVEAMVAIRPIRHVVVVSRDAARGEAFVASLDPLSVTARSGGADAVADADVTVTATSARTPLFDGALPKEGCCVIAIGSHEPDARELDGRLMSRSAVVVEDAEVALREAGDVVLAVDEGAITADALVDLPEVVRGGAPAARGPRVFKSVGMAWEDLVVADAILERFQHEVRRG